MKNKIIILIIAGLIVSIGFHIYNFGQKAEEATRLQGYVEGFAAGQTQLSSGIFQEFRTTGQVRLPYILIADDGSTSTQVIMLKECPTE